MPPAEDAPVETEDIYDFLPQSRVSSQNMTFPDLSSARVPKSPPVAYGRSGLATMGIAAFWLAVDVAVGGNWSRPALMFVIGLAIYLDDVARRKKFKRLMEKIGQRRESD
jgi:hypothetical protein